MKKVSQNESVWYRKYRPRTIDDVILPKEMKETFKKYIENEDFPHILLSSPNPGTGKSSLSFSIVEDLNADVKVINGSQDNGIDTFREEVKHFITSGSLDDSKKIVLVDESCGLSQSAQKNLRGMIEEFSSSTTFIFTCNYIDNIIEPLQNRFVIYDFDEIYVKHKKDIGKQILDRLKFILDNENVEYDVKDLMPIITNNYPSVRAMVGVLQKSVQNGKLVIDENLISLNSKLDKILNYTKEKNFKSIKEELNKMSNVDSIYSYTYKNLDNLFKEESIPQIVITTAKYQDMSSHARDKQITAGAFCVELMMNPKVKFK